MIGDSVKPGAAPPETGPDMLDEALEETFPASDRPAVVLPRETERNGAAEEERAAQRPQGGSTWQPTQR